VPNGGVEQEKGFQPVDIAGIALSDQQGDSRRQDIEGPVAQVDTEQAASQEVQGPLMTKKTSTPKFPNFAQYRKVSPCRPSSMKSLREW
jgi:hypothetical protein